MIKLKLRFLIILFICISFASYSQVVINEYSASNLNSFIDSYGKTEDWIELYNTSSTAVDISGWHLSDKESKPEKWEVPAGTSIPANGYLVFLCSGRDLVTSSGEYHTNFKLSQTKGTDIVLLSDNTGTVLEMYDLDMTLVEHSRCRDTDGSSNWVVSTNPSFGTSNNGTTQVNGYTVAPSMDVDAGYYNSSQTISITNNEPNSVLRYTTDGTNPTDTSPTYTGPITVSQTTVVKAQAFSLDPMILPGRMDFNTYFINEDFSLAVFSVAADEVIDLANGNGVLIPIGSIEYFNLNKEREATSFGDLNRHGQDSWVLDHRSIDWVSRDEMGYSKAVNAPIFGYSERDEYQKFMFRNSGDDNYPAINDGNHDGSTHIRDEYVHTLSQLGGMKLDQRAVERVILFLNGQYWGVYGMRERPVDHDYTDEYYDQGKYEIQYLSTWGDTEIEYGGLQAMADWENLRNFILQNDMSIETNYEIAEDSINMLSLIDYMTMNLNVVASDWLNYNTGWWRGLNPDGDHKKWGYILWDLDASFDYYINYSGVPNISPNAEPCDLEDISSFMDNQFFGTQLSDHGSGNTNPPYWGNVGSHEKIFLKLLDENETFKQLYYSRYADLMNTVFTCDNMITLLDSMLLVIEPEMPRQIQRWGGTMTEWESNVQDLKDFINQRCQLLDDTALNCFTELNGPYQLTLRTQPDGVGEIDLNTLDIEEFPWTGDYFGGMENKIKAKVFDEFDTQWEFSHWETTSGNVILPNVNERKATITLTTMDTLTAVFAPFGSVSNDEIEGLSNFEVFPNPATDYLTVQYDLESSKKVSLELLTTTGQLVTRFGEIEGSAGSHSIDLSLKERGIPSGFYFLVMDIDGFLQTTKVNIVK